MRGLDAFQSFDATTTGIMCHSSPPKLDIEVITKEFSPSSKCLIRLFGSYSLLHPASYGGTLPKFLLSVKLIFRISICLQRN